MKVKSDYGNIFEYTCEFIVIYIALLTFKMKDFTFGQQFIKGYILY